MTLVDSQALLEPAIAIAREAGDIVMEYYENGTAKETVKSDNSAVTDADLASDALITEKLTALPPDIPVVTEEGVEAGIIPDVSGGRYWVCDPIDGTLQFIKKMDTFCILIALIDNNEPVLGICHYPALQETYYAIKGQGAHRINHRSNKTSAVNIKPTASEFPLVVSNPVYNDIGKLNALFGHLPESSRLWKEELYMHNLLVGDIDIIAFTEAGGGEWDLAAMEIILKEAGGDTAQLYDTPSTKYGNPRQKITPKLFLAHADLIRFLIK